MAVGALVDTDALALLDALDALDAVRSRPAPLGLETARVALLAHASAELRGVFLRDLAALDVAAARARNAADLLHEQAGVPVWQARRDAALARRLAVVPGLAQAVADGAVELDAALLLVRAWQALPCRLHDGPLAAALLTLAQLVDLPDLRAEVDELLTTLAPDVTDADLADAREHPTLTLTDVGARTRLTGECDRITGELLREVLPARARATAAPEDARPPAARLMDALIDVVRAGASTDAVPGDPTLVVVATLHDLQAAHDETVPRATPHEAVQDLFGATSLADQDTRTGSSDHPAGEPARHRPAWSAHTRGGVPVGPRTLAAFTCTSTITRLVLSLLGNPLDSSPTTRQLSRRERRALEHRAAYRCQRAGCGRPAATCVPHHVQPWALGGPSTLANTVLLCASCHHLLHDRQHALPLTDGTHIGPRGWLTRTPSPP